MKKTLLIAGLLSIASLHGTNQNPNKEKSRGLTQRFKQKKHCPKSCRKLIFTSPADDNNDDQDKPNGPPNNFGSTFSLLR